MKLPFVRPQPVYHVGELTFDPNGFVRSVPRRMWDFENASFSISLDPNVWAAYGGPQNVYRVETPLKLVDADIAVATYPDEIRDKAVRMDLIKVVAGQIEPQPLLYTCLQATGQVAAGWELHACLGVLAAKDNTVDGLWWSDLHNGKFPATRGGIYQSRLNRHRIAPIQQAPSGGPPAVEWLKSIILS